MAYGQRRGGGRITKNLPFSRTLGCLRRRLDRLPCGVHDRLGRPGGAIDDSSKLVCQLRYIAASLSSIVGGCYSRLGQLPHDDQHEPGNDCDADCRDYQNIRLT